MSRPSRLIPRAEIARWSGPALGHESDPEGDEVDGRCLVVSWLGVHLEFVVARVIRRARS